MWRRGVFRGSKPSPFWKFFLLLRKKYQSTTLNFPIHTKKNSKHPPRSVLQKITPLMWHCEPNCCTVSISLVRIILIKIHRKSMSSHLLGTPFNDLQINSTSSSSNQIKTICQWIQKHLYKFSRSNKQSLLAQKSRFLSWHWMESSLNFRHKKKTDCLCI